MVLESFLNNYGLLNSPLAPWPLPVWDYWITNIKGKEYEQNVNRITRNYREFSKSLQHIQHGNSNNRPR